MRQVDVGQRTTLICYTRIWPPVERDGMRTDRFTAVQSNNRPEGKGQLKKLISFENECNYIASKSNTRERKQIRAATSLWASDLSWVRYPNRSLLPLDSVCSGHTKI